MPGLVGLRRRVEFTAADGMSSSVLQIDEGAEGASIRSLVAQSGVLRNLARGEHFLRNVSQHEQQSFPLRRITWELFALRQILSRNTFLVPSLLFMSPQEREQQADQHAQRMLASGV